MISFRKNSLTTIDITYIIEKTDRECGSYYVVESFTKKSISFYVLVFWLGLLLF